MLKRRWSNQLQPDFPPKGWISRGGILLPPRETRGAVSSVTSCSGKGKKKIRLGGSRPACESEGGGTFVARGHFGLERAGQKGKGKTAIRKRYAREKERVYVFPEAESPN